MSKKNKTKKLKKQVELYKVSLGAESVLNKGTKIIKSKKYNKKKDKQKFRKEVKQYYR